MKTFTRAICVVLIAVIITAVAISASAATVTGKVGDADNDGKITIMDATRIQRFLAELVEDTDGVIVKLGDSNGDGLNIMDATRIQRWLVDFEVNAPIGETIEYEMTDPTEAPTEAPTKKPNYELPPV